MSTSLPGGGELRYRLSCASGDLGFPQDAQFIFRGEGAPLGFRDHFGIRLRRQHRIGARVGWQIDRPGKERARIAYASEKEGRLLFSLLAVADQENFLTS
jgi:hypothetical protein